MKLLRVRMPRKPMLPLLLALLLPVPSPAADFCARTAALLSPGDLLFLRVENDFYARVARTTGGWSNHVGIAFRNPDGTWVVAESTTPKSVTSPLCDFLEGSHKNTLAVRRLRQGISPAQILAMREQAQKRMGLPYDAHFDYDAPKSQYCSKFTYQVFLNALGIEAGFIETLGDLFEKMKSAPNWQADYAFWLVWFRGSIPMEQRIVTPHSQYQAPNFVTVFDNSGTTLRP